MENITSSNFNQVEAQQEQYFKCEKCERTFRRKSSFSRHVLSIHGEADILKLRFRNEHLVQNINLCQEQIRFLKELIILQKSLQRSQSQANEVVSHVNQSTPMSFPSIK